MKLLLGCALLTLALAACGDSSPGPQDQAPVTVDRGRVDLGRGDLGRGDLSRPASETGVSADKAKDCASTFGNALTAAFGRLDGKLLAVVGPKDTQCALPNNDHLVVQVTTKGAAYRMVVNILSTLSGVDPKVRFADVQRPLPAPAWSDGWHTGVALDYPGTLGLHSTGAEFTPHEMNELVKQVSDRLTLGQPISVYATSSGGTLASSAHLIHRNTAGKNVDGAIVLDPTGPTPRFLLFHFANQTF